jgi:O-antigen/teichoic acid export membrane protein
MGETIACLIIWIILVPRIGMVGVVIGTAIGYGFGALLTFIFSRRLMKIKYEWNRLLILSALYFSVIGFASLLPNVLNLTTVFLKICLILCYIGIPFLIPFWRTEELMIAGNIFRQVRSKFIHSVN